MSSNLSFYLTGFELLIIPLGGLERPVDILVTKHKDGDFAGKMVLNIGIRDNSGQIDHKNFVLIPAKPRS